MRRCLAFLLSGTLLTPAWAAYQVSISSDVIVSTQPLENEPYAMFPSTPTAAQLRQMRRHRPRKPPIRQLRNIEQNINRAIKRTSPNPKVQSPTPSPMPGQAPEMPAGPTMPAQPSRMERFLGVVAKIMTKSWGSNLLVWLPAFSTDPNAGPKAGILPVMVLADQTTHHIRHLLAPSYTYNDIYGQTGTWRYYYYPTDASQLFTTASISEHTNREVKARYENSSAHDGVLYILAESYYTVDAANRFFGIGPQTHEGDETGFTSKDAVARAALGINFEHSWRATVGARFRRFATDDTILHHTTNLTDRFPSIPGVGTKNTISQEIRLLWDTRDSPVTPSRGSSGEFFGEKTSLALGSDSDYVRYGLEGKRFFLWRDPNQVTVVRGRYERVNGPYIPFYELSQLGGRDTLRGYGDGRFADRGSLVFNLEQRYTFASVTLMNIQTNFEAAPFFDLGSVFSKLQDMRIKDYRPVYGAAFRAAVKPNVVGDVELGVGKEGPAVFVDINYPF